MHMSLNYIMETARGERKNIKDLFCDWKHMSLKEDIMD